MTAVWIAETRREQADPLRLPEEPSAAFKKLPSRLSIRIKKEDQLPPRFRQESVVPD